MAHTKALSRPRHSRSLYWSLGDAFGFARFFLKCREERLKELTACHR